MQGCIDEGVGGEDAESTRQAVAVGVEERDGWLGEHGLLNASGPEAVVEEGRGLFQAERAEVIAHENALGHRREVLEVEQGTQLGLAAEDEGEGLSASWSPRFCR